MCWIKCELWSCSKDDLKCSKNLFLIAFGFCSFGILICITVFMFYIVHVFWIAAVASQSGSCHLIIYHTMVCTYWTMVLEVFTWMLFPFVPFCAFIFTVTTLYCFCASGWYSMTQITCAR